LVPWILKISAKQGCFLNFEWEKTNFTTFGPLEKFWKNPLVLPLEKILLTPITVSVPFPCTNAEHEAIHAPNYRFLSLLFSAQLDRELNAFSALFGGSQSTGPLTPENINRLR